MAEVKRQAMCLPGYPADRDSVFPEPYSAAFLRVSTPATDAARQSQQEERGSGIKPRLHCKIQSALIVQQLQVAQNVVLHFLWQCFGIKFCSSLMIWRRCVFRRNE